MGLNVFRLDVSRVVVMDSGMDRSIVDRRFVNVIHLMLKMGLN